MPRKKHTPEQVSHTSAFDPHRWHTTSSPFSMDASAIQAQLTLCSRRFDVRQTNFDVADQSISWRQRCLR